MYRHFRRLGTASFIVDIAFAQTGAEVEEVAIGREPTDPATAAYRAAVPSGKVPAIALPDGTLVTESVAILLALDERHRAAGLLPEPASSARAAALRWLMFLATEVYQHDLRYYYPQRYTTDPAGAPGVQAAALDGMTALLGQVDRELAGRVTLVPDHPTIVDAYLLMLVTWVPEYTTMLAGMPNLARAVAATTARPPVAAALAAHAGH